jgi:hypothetical protein
VGPAEQNRTAVSETGGPSRSRKRSRSVYAERTELVYLFSLEGHSLFNNSLTSL